MRLKQFSGGPSFWIANQLVEGDFNFKSNHTMIEGVRRIYFKRINLQDFAPWIHRIHNRTSLPLRQKLIPLLNNRIIHPDS